MNETIRKERNWKGLWISLICGLLMLYLSEYTYSSGGLYSLIIFSIISMCCFYEAIKQAVTYDISTWDRTEKTCIWLSVSCGMIVGLIVYFIIRRKYIEK